MFKKKGEQESDHKQLMRALIGLLMCTPELAALQASRVATFMAYPATKAKLAEYGVQAFNIVEKSPCEQAAFFVFKVSVLCGCVSACGCTEMPLVI